MPSSEQGTWKGFTGAVALKGRTGHKGERHKPGRKCSQGVLGRNFWESWIVGMWVRIREVNIVEDQIEKVGWNYPNLLPINRKYSNKFDNS